MITNRNIGGFLGLESSAFQTVDQNILTLWKINDKNSFTFHNARSAVNYLLHFLKIKKIWLPAYICTEMLCLRENKIDVQFYPIDDHLNPVINFLQHNVHPNECVLAVDYFGKPPSEEFIEFVDQTPEIIWVEDRAQALLPSIKPWGHWVLYSPRKILGVPDGGILVNTTSTIQHPKYQQHSNIEFILPICSRYEEVESISGDEIYQFYRKIEDKMDINFKKISRFTMDLLASVNPGPIIETRKSNYNILYHELFEMSVLKQPADNFVPLGFPIRLKNRDLVCEKLREANIFSAIHWRTLPFDKNQFTNSHRLSNEILTLPCDQRYNESDMKYILDTLKKIL